MSQAIDKQPTAKYYQDNTQAAAVTKTLSVVSTDQTPLVTYVVAEALPKVSDIWFDFGIQVLSEALHDKVHGLGEGTNKSMPYEQKFLQVFSMWLDEDKTASLENFFSKIDSIAEYQGCMPYIDSKQLSRQQMIESIKHNQQHFCTKSNEPQLTISFLNDNITPKLAPHWRIIGYLLIPEDIVKVETIGNDYRNDDETCMTRVFEVAEEMNKKLTYSVLKQLFECPSIDKGGEFPHIEFPEEFRPKQLEKVNSPDNDSPPITATHSQKTNNDHRPIQPVTGERDEQLEQSLTKEGSIRNSEMASNLSLQEFKEKVQQLQEVQGAQSIVKQQIEAELAEEKEQRIDLQSKHQIARCEIQNLHKELNKLKSQNAKTEALKAHQDKQLEKQNIFIKQQKQTYEIKLKTTTGERNEANTKINELNSEISFLKTQARKDKNQASSYNKALQLEIAQLKTELENTKTQLTEKTEPLCIEEQEKNKTIEELKSNNEPLCIENNNLQKQLTAAGKENQQLQKQLQEVEAQLEAKKQDYQKLKTILSSLKSSQQEYIKKDKQIEQLEQKNKALQAELDKKKHRIEVLLNDSLPSATSSINKLKTKVQTLEKEKDQLHAQLQAKQTQGHTSLAANPTPSLFVDALKQFEATFSKMKEADQQTLLPGKLLQVLSKELAELEASIKYIKNEHCALEIQSQQHKQLITERDERVAILTVENDKSTNEMKHMTKQLQSADKIIKELNQQAVKYRETIKALQQQLSQSDAFSAALFK